VTSVSRALDEFIAGLPAGLDSYPECQQKASFYRSNMERNGARLPIDALPAPVQRMLREPLPVSAWISTAQSHAYFIATAGCAFSSDAEFFADTIKGTKSLFSGPLYRLLMMVVSPETALRGANKRWNAMQRGMSIEVVRLEKGRTEALVVAPPGLLPPLIARWYAAAFTAVLELAGAKNARIDVTSCDGAKAVFEGRWE